MVQNHRQLLVTLRVYVAATDIQTGLDKTTGFSLHLGLTTTLGANGCEFLHFVVSHVVLQHTSEDCGSIEHTTSGLLKLINDVTNRNAITKVQRDEASEGHEKYQIWHDDVGDALPTKEDLFALL